MDYAGNVKYLKDQLDQTQLWLENEEIEGNKNTFVVNMIIKGMIETERQIEYFEELEKLTQ